MILATLYFTSLLIGSLGVPIPPGLESNQYYVSAELPFYYRICPESSYLFHKGQYLSLTRRGSWLPTNSTSIVPQTCVQIQGGTSACFLSEIYDMYQRVMNLRYRSMVPQLFRFIRNHCESR